MITVEKIKPEEFSDLCKSLSINHSKEMKEFNDLGYPEIDVEFYNMIRDISAIFVMKDGDVPVGYGSVIVAKHNHYNTLVAKHDTLFVAESHRGQGNALIKKMIEFAKSSGAEMFYWTAKPDSLFYNMLAKKGNIEEIVFKRKL